MKPYGNLSSKNLSLLLNLARIMTILSLFGIVISICAFIYQMVQVPYTMGQLSAFGIGMLPVEMIVLLCSGVIVAIVAFEENYRKKTEAFINSVQK